MSTMSCQQAVSSLPWSISIKRKMWRCSLFHWHKGSTEFIRADEAYSQNNWTRHS